MQNDCSVILERNQFLENELFRKENPVNQNLEKIEEEEDFEEFKEFEEK